VAFRFKVTNGDDTAFTQWVDEVVVGHQPSNAPAEATKIRAANPSARLVVERRTGTAEQLNGAVEVNTTTTTIPDDSDN
jgi:hypothetical protein